MQLERISLITVLSTNFIIAVILAAMAFRRRKQAGTKEFLGFSVAIMVFIFGYIFEVASDTLPQMLFWLKIQYLGLPLISFFWLLLSIRYSGWESRLRPYLIKMAFMVALMIIIMHSTNEYHHLYYSGIKFEGQGPFPTFSVTQGPWYMVYIFYVHMMVLGAAYLLIKFRKKAPQIFRDQIKTMLWVSFIPMSANLLYQLRLIVWEPSPVAFVLGELLIARGLFKQKLFDLAPIARDKIFESINDGVVVLDREDRIVDLNSAAGLIIPELNSNAIGCNITETVSRYPALAGQISEKAEQVEFEIKAAEGKRWIYSRLSSIIINEEGVIGRLLILNDVTSRKLEQAHLIQTEKMAVLGQLVANVSHEMNTPIAAVKATAENMLESHFRFYQRLDALIVELDVKWKPLILETMWKVQEAPRQTAREEREAMRRLLEFIKARNLKVPAESVSLIVKLGLAEEFPQLVPIFQDPRSAAILNLILETTFWRRDLQNILLAQERTSKTLYALKSYSHTPGEKRLVATDIRASIELVLQLYQNLLKKGIRTVVNAGPVPPVLAYPDELQQVWTNLIYNAIQAMEGAGELTINIGLEDNQAVVKIVDNGPGIPKEILAKVFEPFFTTKGAGEGSGLGLPICKRIIEAHQGRMVIQSRPGQTEVSVYLPTGNPERR